MKNQYMILALLLAMLLFGAYSPNKVNNGFEAVDYEDVDFY